MLYLRFSLLAPFQEHEVEVRDLERELLAFLSQQPGFVDGFLLTATDGSMEMGRVTVWRSEADADHAATLDHVLAVRSRLLETTEEERLERSFQAARYDGS